MADTFTLDGFLARFDYLSLFILAAADMVGAVTELAVPLVGFGITAVTVAPVAAILILANQLFTRGTSKRNIIDALLVAAISWFIIAIPTPVFGILVLGAKMLHDFAKNLWKSRLFLVSVLIVILLYFNVIAVEEPIKSLALLGAGAYAVYEVFKKVG